MWAEHLSLSIKYYSMSQLSHLYILYTVHIAHTVQIEHIVNCSFII